MSNHDRQAVPTMSIVGFVVLFVAMMAVAIGKETGAIDHDLAKRGVGAILGLMLMGAGNLLPKFRLFDAVHRDPATALAAERFAGWAFVLAGAAYVAVWTLAPMPGAIVISSMIGLGAFALVGLDGIRRVCGAKESPTTRQTCGATLAKRAVLGMLILTFGTVISMFLVDYIWGDEVSWWIGVIYPIMITPLMIAGSRQPASQPPSEN